MEQPEFLHGLIRQMEVFADAVAMQPDLMRFRFLLPKDILPRLRDLALARKELPDARTDGAAFGKAERAELKRGRSAETLAASPAFFFVGRHPCQTNEDEVYITHKGVRMI